MSEPKTLRALAAKWREARDNLLGAAKTDSYPQTLTICACDYERCADELDALADALEARCICPEHMWTGDEMSESLCKLSEEEHFLLFALIGHKVQP